MTIEPTEVVDRYELYGELAAGGMATVYLGRMTGGSGFARPVAIKRLHAHLVADPDLALLLREEARLTQRIRHPNVVATVDVVAAERELLLVMEYVHGETLARLLRACKEASETCPPAVAARIVHEVLLGLHAAHESTDAGGKRLSIVHRDVSPQNVIVGADGIARLLDFGIAKAFDSVSHTREGQLKGKVPYMAPELLRFQPATPQTDIWAAAVVLWETLCARRLFRGESEMSIWGKVVEGAIPAPAEVLGAPSPLDDVVLKGLSRDVNVRYPTALAMAHGIERASRLASPTEVAAWVAKFAGPALASRDRLLRDVETSPVRVPLGLAAETRSSNALAAHASSNSPLAQTTDTVSMRVANAVSPSRRRWMLWAVPFIAMLTAGGLASRAQPQQPTPATPATPPAPATRSAPSAPSVSESTNPAAALDAASSLPVGGASSSVAVARDASAPFWHRTKTGTSGHALVRLDAGATAVIPSASGTVKVKDCDPPYYVDSAGIKRFKLDCVTGEP